MNRQADRQNNRRVHTHTHTHTRLKHIILILKQFNISRKNNKIFQCYVIGRNNSQLVCVFVSQSVLLSVFLSVYLPVCLFVCLLGWSANLAMGCHVTVWLINQLPECWLVACLPMDNSACLCMSVCIYIYIYIYIHPSVCIMASWPYSCIGLYRLEQSILRCLLLMTDRTSGWKRIMKYSIITLMILTDVNILVMSSWG